MHMTGVGMKGMVREDRRKCQIDTGKHCVQTWPQLYSSLSQQKSTWALLEIINLNAVKWFVTNANTELLVSQ